MRVPPVKGTRDFYPEDLAPLNHIFDVWRRVSLRHGFVEFDGPTLEHVDLYSQKSGPEIVGQLFHLTDRADRRLALRPEMTPTLARMVAARYHALAKPIKWFCIPRLYRGENPQRGRLREFFQWNVDIIGVDDALADAECIAVAAECLSEFGLGSQEVVICISDRRLITAVFDGTNMSDVARSWAFQLLDKAADMDPAEFAEKWSEEPGKFLPIGGLRRLLDCDTLDSIGELAKSLGAHPERIAGIIEADKRVMGCLGDLGVADYCVFDIRVVRGLAYYTGPVFEAYDRGRKERAICGGGRYDDLLSSPKLGNVPAVGFGMGDVVLSLLLADRGKLPTAVGGLQAFVIDADPQAFPRVLSLTAELRRAGLRADYDYKRRAVGKQFAAAGSRNARWAVIVRAETAADGLVAVKDMQSGVQADVPVTRLTSEPPEKWLSR